MELCSETLAYKIQTSGNYPKEIILHTYLPLKMEQRSETSAYKIQKPGNHPEETIQQLGINHPYFCGVYVYIHCSNEDTTYASVTPLASHIVTKNPISVFIKLPCVNIDIYSLTHI